MANTETLNAICEQYAPEKHNGSFMDARLEMIRELADLREQLANARGVLAQVLQASDAAEDARDFARLVEPLIPAIRVAAR